MNGIGLLVPAALLIPCSAVAALTPGECSVVSRAHERLLESSFQTERTFTLTVNGDLKNREVARLSYSAGELETEVLEYEARSKMWVYENEGRDFVLEASFGCDRLEAAGGSRYELTSEDGSEVAEFELEDESGTLRPIAWRSDETARVLFKKFAISARVVYADFEWR